VVNGPPQVVDFAVDPHENLIQMPPPLRQAPYRRNPLLSDFRCKHRSEPVPPGTYCFVADIDPSLLEQVFDLAQRGGKADIHHDRKTDDLRRSLEIAEWISHPKTPRNVPHRLKSVCPDTAGLRNADGHEPPQMIDQTKFPRRVRSGRSSDRFGVSARCQEQKHDVHAERRGSPGSSVDSICRISVSSLIRTAEIALRVKKPTALVSPRSMACRRAEIS